MIIISLLISLFGDLSRADVTEVPVFKINFYLMGQQDVDQNITVQIGDNIEYLNEEFEGRIRFELDHLVMDPNHAYIPDLHEDHLTKNRERVDALVSPVEISGGINIYLFDTYSENDGYTAMMGFTPVLSAQHKNYQATSPQFDRLFISYPGLIDKSTLVHEMGHFLGLSHPWEMNEIDLELMGFVENDAERNHMTYHPEVNHFSLQQLDRMQHFALNFRQYLLSRIDRKYTPPSQKQNRSLAINPWH